MTPVNRQCECGFYRIVECRPARVMLFPVMEEGRVPPPCRSSIERLQGLDLSITASGSFSADSPSNLLRHENKKPVEVFVNNNLKKNTHNLHFIFVCSYLVTQHAKS